MPYLITAIIMIMLGLACTYLLMIETIKYKRQSIRYQKILKNQENNKL